MQTAAPTDVTYVPQQDEGGRFILTGCGRCRALLKPNLAAVLVSLLLSWQWCGCAIDPHAVPLLLLQIPGLRLQHVEIWSVAKINQQRELNKERVLAHTQMYRQGAVAGTGFPWADSSLVFATSRAPAQQASCMPTESPSTAKHPQSAQLRVSFSSMSHGPLDLISKQDISQISSY